MKKIVPILLAAALLTLPACAGTDANTSASSTTATQTTAATTVPQTTAVPTEAGFEEIVLVDDENITVKITAVEEDPIWGYTLKVYLENKTDLELMFSLNDVSVNGFMCDPFWAETVAAGKKSNASISWLSDDFAANGITQVTDIDFTLRVYDNNDWAADDILNQAFTVTP